MAGVNFLPIQSGTGDPSPTNVRPISPGLTITGIGDIYGGYLDVAHGTVVATWSAATLDGDTNWNTYSIYGFNINMSSKGMKAGTRLDGYANYLLLETHGRVDVPYSVWFGAGTAIMYVLNVSDLLEENTVTGWKAYLTEHPLTVAFQLATPIIHALTSSQLAEAMQQLNVHPASMLERRRRIVMAQPHLVTPTPANPVAFAATLAAPIKGLACAFSPVQAAGTPAPDNVLPISGWTNCNVVRCGKNLFGGTLGSGTYVDINVVAGQKYTISAKMVDASISTFLQVKRTPTGQESWETVASPISNYTVAAKTFTVESGYRYALYSNSSYTNVTDVQLELGSTATSYAPYTGQTLAVQFPAEAGTIYGGYIDPVRGVARATHYLARASKNQFGPAQGETQYRQTSAIYPSTSIGTNITKARNTQKMNIGAIANPYSETGYGDYIGCFFSQNNLNYIRISGALYDALGDNDTVEISYELATPIEYPLTPAVLKTLKGANVLYTSLNGNVSPIYWTN